MLNAISSLSEQCLGIQMGARIHAGGSAPGSATWPSTTIQIWVPLNLDRGYEVKRYFWANGAAVAGNVDVAVATLNGLILCSASNGVAGIGQSGTNTGQTVLAPTYTYIPPGAYMMGMGCSSTTAQFLRQSTTAARNAQMLGCVQVSSAIPIGAPGSTVTFASIVSTYIPIFGISRIDLL